MDLARIGAVGTSHFDGVSGAPSFGWLLLKTVLILLAVCVLAYLVLRFVLKRYVPSRGGLRSGGMTIIERLNLGPRQSICVVRVGPRFFLLGMSENGINQLSELDPADWRDEEPPEGVVDASGPRGKRFREQIEKLAAVRSKKTPVGEVNDRIDLGPGPRDKEETKA